MTAGGMSNIWIRNLTTFTDADSFNSTTTDAVDSEGIIKVMKICDRFLDRQAIFYRVLVYSPRYRLLVDIVSQMNHCVLPGCWLHSQQLFSQCCFFFFIPSFCGLLVHCSTLLTNKNRLIKNANIYVYNFVSILPKWQHVCTGVWCFFFHILAPSWTSSPCMAIICPVEEQEGSPPNGTLTVSIHTASTLVP